MPGQNDEAISMMIASGKELETIVCDPQAGLGGRSEPW